MIFRDRTHAGQILAGLLPKYAHRPDTVVLGLPRGGVPVAYEIAKALDVVLDVFVVRKLGVPGHEELAMGAVATGGIRYINQRIVDALGIDAQTIEAAIEREAETIRKREEVYRGHRPPIDVRGKIVILVDDGLATGSTMHAAIAALRQRGPSRIVVAVPAGSPNVCSEINHEVDETVCASTTESFHSVSQWYEEFSQTTDDEVQELLARAPWTGDATHFSVPIDGTRLQGDLAISSNSKGLVIFAHGSGSSRHSPRNKHVARILYRARLATLLVDLLTVEEETIDRRTSEFRFNIELLANRLVIVTDWLVGHRALSSFPMGLFGASTGAAAALIAAAKRPNIIKAVVSRGGRVDLAGDALRKVISPTLLIVGEFDEQVLELNRQAASVMPGQTAIEIVPGAGHLFEEPAALDEVASLARNWFDSKLDHRQQAA